MESTLIINKKDNDVTKKHKQEGRKGCVIRN
jgi:hypothetical protein